MEHITIGSRVPDVTFRNRLNGEWESPTSEDIFAGKKVVLFALPGAFTPTCSSSHLPRYNELAPTMKEAGVDEIICLSVNDGFVMEAWAADQDAANIRFLADGNGEFSDGMGMLVDKSDIGFGKRSWRYSALIVDGVVEQLFVEEDVPGDPFEVSDADTMLAAVDPQAKTPDSIMVVSKPGCPHCARAKAALADKGLAYDEIVLGQNGLSMSSLAAMTGKLTVPQVFIGGELIGGADELAAHLSS